MLGDGYIAQHIQAQVRRESEEHAYRVYVTDALFALGRMKRRWEDIMQDARRPEETRSAGEIKEHMLQKLNG